MSYVTPVYCTDEDLAVRAVGDFANLCPHWQRLAAGVDGVIGPADPWTLSSPTVDFSAAGLAPGHVVRLTKPTTRYGPSGDLYAVESASAITGAATLRNIGLAAATGVPPGPAAGLTGVNFEVPTFYPQIESATYQINEDYRIDAVDPDREATDLYNPRELRSLCVLLVLRQMYTVENRAETGDYVQKIERLTAEIDALVPRIRIRWGPQGEDTPPTGTFGVRTYR